MNRLLPHYCQRSAIVLLLFGLTTYVNAQPPAAPAPASPCVLDGSDAVWSDSCCPAPCCCCDPGPTWTVSAGTIILNRSNPDGDPLYQDATDSLFGSDFDLGWQAGYELGFVWHNVTERDAIVARLFVVDGWSAQANALIPGNTQINTNPSIPMVGPRDITSELGSELLSFELNYVWESAWTPAVKWLVGLRTLELDEAMSTQMVHPPAGFPTEFHTVATRNRLYGAQIGTEVDFYSSDRLALRGTLSAGIYGNVAHHQSAAWDDVTAPTYANDRDSAAAFVGETGLSATYAVTSGISLRADYRVLWASGLALATEQVAVTNFNLGSGIDNDATAFYHGVFVGLDWSF